MPRLKEAVQKRQAESEGKDPRIVAIEALSKELHAEGKDLIIERGQVRPAPPQVDSAHVITVGEESYLRLGIVSDTHLGSQFEQLTALRDFYHRASDMGVHRFLHAGDMHQGTYSNRKHDQYVHAEGADAQVAYAAEVYPRGEDGQATTVISGNHDDSFMRDGGTNVCRALASRREDIEYIGQDSAYLTIDGVRFYLIHPEGGGAYAKSYKPQKLAEVIPRDREVQVAGIGHYHTWGTFDYQDTIALMLPCFQGQYPWLMRKFLYPTIGGVILEAWHDGSRITRVRWELVRYRERANDYDEAVSAEVRRL